MLRNGSGDTDSGSRRRVDSSSSSNAGGRLCGCSVSTATRVLACVVFVSLVAVWWVAQLPIRVPLHLALAHSSTHGIASVGVAAYSLRNVWSNRTHAALCRDVRVATATDETAEWRRSDALKADSVHTATPAPALECTDFLHRAGSGAAWDVLEAGVISGTAWIELLYQNPAMMFSGSYSHALPLCKRVIRGRTIVVPYNDHTYFHFVLRRLWFVYHSLPDRDVTQMPDQLYVRFDDSADSIRITNFDDADSDGPRTPPLPPAYLALMRYFTAPAAVAITRRDASSGGAAGSGPGTAATGSWQRSTPIIYDIDPSLEAHAPAEVVSRLHHGRSPICFDELVPRAYHSNFATETDRLYTADECRTTRATGDLPAFASYVFRALQFVKRADARRATGDAAVLPTAISGRHQTCNRSLLSAMCDVCTSRHPLVIFSRPTPRSITNERGLILQLIAAFGGGAAASARIRVVDGATDAIWYQAEMAHSACGIVGMHGSALTNIIFAVAEPAPEPARAFLPPLIEVFGYVSRDQLPRAAPLAVFNNLACAIGIPYARYVSPLPIPTERQSDIRQRPATVEIDALIRIVSQTIAAAAGVSAITTPTV